MTKRWWVVAVLLVAGVVTAAIVVPRRVDEPKNAAASTPDKPVGVGCLGRIEPEDGVIVVAAPYFAGRPSVIRELRVKEGDWVRNGQAIAVVDGWYPLEKALREKEADVEVARKKLAQVLAGSKQADIDAQKMEVARWEAEFEIATSQYRRYERLVENQIVSASELEQRRLVMDRSKRTLDAARERLKSLEEIRKEDVDVLSAELSAAIAQVERARVEVEGLIIRAPASGRVLKVHTHPGEEAGTEGVVELAKTDRMYVVAEVYESDIARVRLGQTAKVSGTLLPEGLTGAVTHIDPQVTKAALLPSEPASFSDTRVVKVKIQLQNAERAAGLIYGKVDVVIQP